MMTCIYVLDQTNKVHSDAKTKVEQLEQDVADLQQALMTSRNKRMRCFRRSKVDRDSDNQQLLKLIEKDVVSSVATVLSDLCVPGEWMLMQKLHAEVVRFISGVQGISIRLLQIDRKGHKSALFSRGRIGLEERPILHETMLMSLSYEFDKLIRLKWDVLLEGKHRRIQFINKLWTNPHDSAHVQESAYIVAKLVGFREGGNLSKQMFELNFVLPSDDRPWIMGWKPISNLLNL
ncbi:kinesin-like protein NACK1 [Tanacetum coccineum]